MEEKENNLCCFLPLRPLPPRWLEIKWDGDQLEVTFYHVESDKILNGFRVVQLSDLHLKEFGEKNQELVERGEKAEAG